MRAAAQICKIFSCFIYWDFFVRYLLNKAKSVNVSVENYPELEKYIVYVSTYAAADKTKVIDEVTALENKIRETLYQNDKQRGLDKLSKNLAILKNIFNISLTKEDYKYYIDNEQSFNASNYTSFISKEAPLYKITAQLDKNIIDLHRGRIWAESEPGKDSRFILTLPKDLRKSRQPRN